MCRRVGCVFLIALGVRLVFLFGLALPLADTGMFDKQEILLFEQRAEHVLEGEQQFAYHEWPVVYFIAGVWAMFGKSDLALSIVSVVISSLTCLLIYGIGQSLGGTRLGLASALIAAVYPEMIYWSVLPRKELLLGFFIAFLSFLILWNRRRVLQLLSFFVVGFLVAVSRIQWVVYPLFLGVLQVGSWLSRVVRRRAFSLIAVSGVLGVGVVLALLPGILLGVLPPAVWDPIEHAYVSSTGLAFQWWQPGWMLPRLGSGFAQLWAIAPRTGYGNLGLLLIPFSVSAYLLGLLGVVSVLRSAVNRSTWVTHVIAPFLLMSVVLSVSAPFMRYRYPLLVPLCLLAGYGTLWGVDRLPFRRSRAHQDASWFSAS